MLYLNMFITMYQGLNKPMSVPLHNKIEYFNEAIIGVCTILMMCYTEWVPDRQMQTRVGWMGYGHLHDSAYWSGSLFRLLLWHQG